MNSAKSFEYRIGLERELHRIDNNFSLSKKNHPLSLGSSFFNPYITTDFAESQTELITDVCQNTEKVLEFLQNLMIYTKNGLKDELIYNFSPPLDEFNKYITVAKFENLKEAGKKRIYRHGLMHRYHQNRQMLTGFHVNFSFTDKFLELKKKQDGFVGSLNAYKSSFYMGIMRNFMRYGWILIYLFGASPQLPSLNKSYLNACSLRMSRLGYCTKAQDELDISLNSLSEYQYDLSQILNKVCVDYENKDYTQLNPNILQDPSEYYTPIRPKVKNGHIEYLEIRCLDINPYKPCGIDQNELDFVRDLLFNFSSMQSKPLNFIQLQELKDNFHTVALNGLDDAQQLTINNEKKPLASFAHEILLKLNRPKRVLKKEGLPSYKLQQFKTDKEIIQFLQGRQKIDQKFYNKTVQSKYLNLFEAAKKSSLLQLDKALMR